MDEQYFHLRNVAHLGDAVYELFIREITINMTSDTQKLHKLTTSFVISLLGNDGTGVAIATGVVTLVIFISLPP